MPKTRKPVADYITFQQYEKMLKEEKDPRMRLLYRYIWGFMLRISEAVGQNKYDVEDILEHRKENKTPKSMYMWTGPIPGIRPVDIDASPAAYKANHTLRVYRKMGKFAILPFNDKQLYEDTKLTIGAYGIGPEDRIFPYDRNDVLRAMQLHGYTVGGQTRIHPHALRRGGGVHMRNKGLKLEVLQRVYSHTNMSQTLQYIGIDDKQAMEDFASIQLTMNKRRKK